MNIPDDSGARTRQDEWLVVRCQLGEREAFDELIARWHEPIWRYARRLGRSDDEADDATQEIWLRVFRGIARLRDGARLRPWLFGIARRALMDRLRVRYAAPAAADVDITEIVADDTTADLDADLEALEAGLAQLPVVERDVLALFYLEELSLIDVAQVLDVPVGTVKSRLFRARQLLRRALDTKGARS